MFKSSECFVARFCLFALWTMFIAFGIATNLPKNFFKWFKESKGKPSKSFSYRFRAQESKAFLTHFPEIGGLLLKHVKAGHRFPMYQEAVLFIVHFTYLISYLFVIYHLVNMLYTLEDIGYIYPSFDFRGGPWGSLMIMKESCSHVYWYRHWYQSNEENPTRM